MTPHCHFSARSSRCPSRYGFGLLVCLGFGLPAGNAVAEDAVAKNGVAKNAVAKEEMVFAQCVRDFQVQARAEGLPEWVVNEVLPALQQQDRVLELDRRQPEFTQTFGRYLAPRASEQRVEDGRRLYQEYRPYLDELTRRYGVPGRYLVAFWGLETNFGRYLGKMPTLDSLATLACDPRRRAYFTGELMTALQLMSAQQLTPQDMQGSWAGAMGHTQFMPSAYHRYAVDGDGDGHINLWQSERDALASGAHYLQSLGWVERERWGREVSLPKDFPYHQTGLKNKRPMTEWAKLGVQQANGHPLAREDMQGAILLPAGQNGPAFLVYDNFEVIMRWNRSEFYALSVGILADRIAGAGRLYRPPSEAEAPLSRERVRLIQSRLNALGFDAGEEDGMLGSFTRSALRAYQQSVGMVADGYPDIMALQSLGVPVEPETAQ